MVYMPQPVTSKQQRERHAGAERYDGCGPSLAVVPRELSFLVAVVVATHDISAYRQVERKVVRQDDVIAAADSATKEMTLTMMAVEPAEMELVDVEASARDIDGGVGTGEGAVSPQPELGLVGEVLPLRAANLQRIVCGDDAGRGVVRQLIFKTKGGTADTIQQKVGLDGETLRTCCAKREQKQGDSYHGSPTSVCCM